MSVHDYAAMLFRSGRIAAFQAAIEAAVRPGSRVLDLGTGLGTFALFAARAGAERVVALDADRVVHLACDVAAANGLADRIEWIHGRAPDALPDGPYDLVVFEDYPTTLLDRRAHRLLRDLCERRLAPDGLLLPDAARLSVALVGGDAWRADRLLPASGAPDFGLAWEPLERHLANSGRQAVLPPSALVAPPATGPVIPLRPPPDAEALGVEAEWDAPADAVVGIALWHDLRVGEDTWMTNRPADRAEPWGQWLLPVHPPLRAPAGSTVQVRVWREALADGAPGFMGWSCEAGGEARRGHDFAGMPLGVEELLEEGRKRPDPAARASPGEG